MIPVNEPLFIGNEKKYLAECVETGWISSEGPFVRRLEEGMAARCGRKHGIAVCNGTAALDAAVAALRLGPGDEVILPTFTIISCAAAIVRAGATPVVVDADPQTWNMDVEQVRRFVVQSCAFGNGELRNRNTGRRVKAIMAVHIYGLPVDMDPLLELADAYGLKIIEDAAEEIGQQYSSQRSAVGGQQSAVSSQQSAAGADGKQLRPETQNEELGTKNTVPGAPRPCGSFGDISTLSFYPNKHVTTGEGGMVLTDDPALAERCRALRNLCFQPQNDKRFVHEEMGWNFRMSNLQAAVGCAQLERLDEFVERKRRMGKRYNELFSSLTSCLLPLASTPYAENIYWVYGIVLNDEVPFDAAEAMRRLAAAGIGTRPFFWPIHEQPVFRRMGLFVGERLPVAERLARRGLYVPSGLALTEEQIKEVARVAREVLG
jgi:perosamine synthetase